MKKKSSWIFVAVCALALAVTMTLATPSQAQDQSTQPKEKPPMYTYIASWVIPRAQWGELAKSANANQALMEKAMADGAIVGFGNDESEVHQLDGATHDNWWSSMSMSGLLSILDRLAKSGSSTSSVLSTATKHWDNIAVSTYYNWHPGSFKGAYTRVAAFKLKPEASNDSVDTLSRNLFVPLFEKMLSNGTILEYEIDTEAIHTDNPSLFWVVFVTPNAEGLDKFDAGLRESMKMNPMGGSALESMVDYSAHRDFLNSSVGTYK